MFFLPTYKSLKNSTGKYYLKKIWIQILWNTFPSLSLDFFIFHCSWERNLNFWWVLSPKLYVKIGKTFMLNFIAWINSLSYLFKNYFLIYTVEQLKSNDIIVHFFFPKYQKERLHRSIWKIKWTKSSFSISTVRNREKWGFF